MVFVPYAACFTVKNKNIESNLVFLGYKEILVYKRKIDPYIYVQRNSFFTKEIVG